MMTFFQDLVGLGSYGDNHSILRQTTPILYTLGVYGGKILSSTALMGARSGNLGHPPGGKRL